MQKTVKIIVITMTGIIGLCLLLFVILLIGLFLMTEPPPSEVIHKAMEYGKYNIILVSRHNSSRFSCNRELYAEVWSNDKQIHSYFITRLDAPDDYGNRVKNVTVLPDTEEIKIEGVYSFPRKPSNGIDLFKITKTINDDLKFDVKLPSKISINSEKLICKISFTNISKYSVSIPRHLLDGKGICYYYELYDEFGHKIVPDIIREHNLSPDTHDVMSTLLLSGETKSDTDYLDVKSLFPEPGHYRMVFYWEGFLDGDIKGEPSRFSCEKWIEVTK